MTKADLLSQKSDALPSVFLKMAQYAANQCTGCSDSPMILAFKAQQVMLEAHNREKIPLKNSIRSSELQFLRKCYYL